jgi:hypothetical protein
VGMTLADQDAALPNQHLPLPNQRPKRDYPSEAALSSAKLRSETHIFDAPMIPAKVEEAAAVVAPPPPWTPPHPARTPSWSNMADIPTAADVCSCCRGSSWWTERHNPRGWRCSVCHPPLHLTPDAVRRAPPQDADRAR